MSWSTSCGAAGVVDDAGEGADHVVLVGAEVGVEPHEVAW